MGATGRGMVSMHDMELARRAGADAAQSQEENESLSFIWYFAQQRAGTLSRCTPIAFQFEPIANGTNGQVPYALPFTFIGTMANGPTIFLPAIQNSIDETYTWNASFASGAQFVISFVDANGQAGGTGPLYTSINDGPCGSPPPDFGDLSFTLNTQNPQTCTPLTATVQGGTPPYTMTIYKSADRPVNMTNGMSNQLTWVNTLSASGNFIVGVTDSKGLSARNSDVVYSNGGPDISCLISHTSGNHTGPNDAPPPPGGHSVVGAVIGGAVGGAALFAIIFFGVWWYRRRRRRDVALRRGQSLLSHADLPTFSSSYRHERLPSISSTEKLQGVVGTLRHTDSSGSPVSSPADERTYGFGPGSVVRNGSRRSTNTSSNPDYYSAVMSRANGTRRTSSGEPPSSTLFTIRQHEDAGAVGSGSSSSQQRVVDLPPQYGAFSGSAEAALMADLASVRPKGHTGPQEE